MVGRRGSTFNLNGGNMEELKEQYEKPEVESEELYERTALSCSGAAFPNAALNLKDNSLNCGFSDS